MNRMAVRVGVGTRVVYDGEIVEITELHPSSGGTEAILRTSRTQHVMRMAVRELLTGERAQILCSDAGPSSDDPIDIPVVILANLSATERQIVLERAAHLREVLIRKLGDGGA